MRNTGKLNDVFTNSFYASHIINGAGTGGIVCLMISSLSKSKIIKRLEDHQQHLMSQKISVKRFNIKVSGIDYDAKYVFSDAGYNFYLQEISAAFAIEQLEKIKR